MSNAPNSFNPSDYEFLVKSLTEGNAVTKAESLKRFNSLVTTDKKQFAIYAKRIVLAIQDLMFEAKEDINLLASNLTLEIINLNPKEIEYYVRSKLLKSIVKNLGDSKPQIRKTSHYCLLAYIKTYKSFEEAIQVYVNEGIKSKEWQLRQKSINSLQSIMIMEMRYVNWDSAEFKKMFEHLIERLKDENAYVQKAAEQCLVSLCKMDDLRAFSKSLSASSFKIVREFCEMQVEAGVIPEVKLDIEKQEKRPVMPQKIFADFNRHESSKSLSNPVNPVNAVNPMLNLEKLRLAQENAQKKAIINRIEEIRKNNSTVQIPAPKPQRQDKLLPLKKADSLVMANTLKEMKRKAQETRNREREKPSEIKLEPIKREPVEKVQRERIMPSIEPLNKEEKAELMSRKLVDNMKNDKDWKIRLEAMEEFQVKFQTNREHFDSETLSKIYLPVLVKLLGDANFKVALIALKVIEELIHVPKIGLENIVAPLMERLSDNKIALRQNVSKLIRAEYLKSKQSIWIDSLLTQLKRSSNSNTKEEILSILSRFYEERQCQNYPVAKVVDSVCPLMEDLKTKIKIKTLDLLVLVTVKSQPQEEVKHMLMGKLNQVYYEMYSEKLNKELKSIEKETAKASITSLSGDEANSPVSTGRARVTSVASRRYGKNLVNSTSTSLQRAHKFDPHDTSRTSSFIDRSSKKTESIRMSEELQSTPSKASLHDPDLSSNSIKATSTEKKRSFLKSFRKKTQRAFDRNSTNYSSNSDLEPFPDPEKQLRNILSEIKSADWEICLEALNKTRVIVAQHRQLLSSSVLKTLAPDIVKLVENLRSSLSKNAVLTLNDLSNKVKKALDPEFENTYSRLIKKSLDTNSFISEEVRKVLVSLCSHCGEGKVLSSLTNSHTSRAIPIKSTVVHILENIAFLPRFYEKQLDRVVVILNDFMSEGSSEIREKTKALLNEILASEKGKSIQRLISSEHLAKLKKVHEEKIPELRIIEKSEERPSQSLIVPAKDETQVSAFQSGKKRKQKISVFSEDFNKIEGLLEKCESSDWKVRSESMTEISTVYLTHPEEGSQHRLSPKFIDILSKQISDPNVKVATNALRIFKNLAEIIPSLVENNLSVILNETFNCFASQKQDVRELSEEFFDVMAVNVEKWMLLQHMCNGTLYGIQKAKPIIIEKLSLIAGEAYSIKPNIFHKNVFPMINKVAEDNKPEVTGALKRLLRTLEDQIGSAFIDILKPKARQLMVQ